MISGPASCADSPRELLIEQFERSNDSANRRATAGNKSGQTPARHSGHGHFPPFRPLSRPLFALVNWRPPALHMGCCFVSLIGQETARERDRCRRERPARPSEEQNNTRPFYAMNRRLSRLLSLSRTNVQANWLTYDEHEQEQLTFAPFVSGLLVLLVCELLISSLVSESLS